MKECRQIAERIYQYVFWENEDQTGLEVNITVLLDEDKALIIDTAFPRHALEVKSDLETKGFTATTIILSHYHPDHAAGASEFPNAKVACSAHYLENYTNCTQIWDPDHPYRKADLPIRNHDQMHFGSFALDFVETPGHSKCSIAIIINRNIVHVGDLAMSNSEGLPTLPYLSQDGDFLEHIQSLKHLQALQPAILLLSHGPSIRGESVIAHSLEARIRYLQGILDSHGTADLEALLEGGPEHWSFTDWHVANLKRFQQKID